MPFMAIFALFVATVQRMKDFEGHAYRFRSHVRNMIYLNLLEY